MQGQQYRWPQRVTTGSEAKSKQMLQSKPPEMFSVSGSAAAVAEMDFQSWAKHGSNAIEFYLVICCSWCLKSGDKEELTD